MNPESGQKDTTVTIPGDVTDVGDDANAQGATGTGDIRFFLQRAFGGMNHLR